MSPWDIRQGYPFVYLDHIKFYRAWLILSTHQIFSILKPPLLLRPFTSARALAGQVPGDYRVVTDLAVSSSTPVRDRPPGSTACPVPTTYDRFFQGFSYHYHLFGWFFLCCKKMVIKQPILCSSFCHCFDLFIT